MSRSLRLLLLLTTVFCCSVVLFAQRGARTQSRGLDQLTSEADLIVRGSVVSARVEPHPKYANLTTVVVTLNVEKTLKGESASNIEFRQYIWDIRDTADAAGYRKGQHLLLLLGPESQIGLRSPVGLGQGRFTITSDETGKLKAVNESANVGLFSQTEQRLQAQGQKLSAPTAKFVRQATPGAIDLNGIESAISEFAGAAR